MQPATSPRRATAISIAATTMRAFVRESMAQPTIRFEKQSLIAQKVELAFAAVVLGDVGEPAVVGLAGDIEDPARHRDGDPVGGELTDERVHPFPGRFACDR